MTPGSQEAVANGCTCPINDNANGKGVPMADGNAFWINDQCPLHGIRDEFMAWQRKRGMISEHDESDNIKDIFSKT